MKKHEIRIDAVQHPDPLEYTVTDPKAHIDVHLENGAQATVSLVFDPAEASQVSVHVTLERDARLTLLCLHTASAPLSVVHTSDLADTAHLHVQNISLGAKTEHTVTSELKGDGAVSDIDWVFYARGTDTHTLSAKNLFSGQRGGGQISIKGVAEQKAHVDCQGMIAIAETGAGTETYLSEDVLMLDETAKVDAVPGLEIKTNDVSASHSATVSKVTPEDLFYFASRGIGEEQARSMYVQGFLGDLVGKILDANTRETILQSIERKRIA